MDEWYYHYARSANPFHLWAGGPSTCTCRENAVAHRVPGGVPAELAGLATPLSNGIERALLDAGVGYGSTKKLTEKAITIKSARRHSRRACELAMERLASGASRWSR